VTWTPAALIAFEERMVKRFEAGEIKAPLHLAGGNERALISYFDEHVKPDDWVLGSWRAHYHALLHGVPEEEVEAAIVAGRSIALTFPRHRVLCSAIVGGIGPIATGLGWAIKRRRGNERVHVFCGDMTAQTGIYHECVKYCTGHRLPVRFVIEDNGLSVSTPTRDVWGELSREWGAPIVVYHEARYSYTLTRPHVGIGKWVSF
jgi:TPP-dependent pyruvate/acetoin dehydrogenase alpha subunit